MKIASKSQKAVDLVQEALEKVEKYKDYNIFNFVNAENALKKAAIIDAKIEKGEPVGRLAGVPFAIKDNFLSPEGETTASAKILTGFTSPVTATAVKKLEDEGAIMIGRTNLDAFAHGSSTENSYFGVTKNAYDKTRVAGGSSGGSAVAVALDIVQFATGTDTGGSIRQPASFNGVFGLKPTYGAISRYGVVAMASSTDCVGFFTNSASDLDLLMSITAGLDPKDETTLPDFYNVEGDETIASETLRSSRASHSARSPQRRASATRVEGAIASSQTIGIIKDFNSDILDKKVKELKDKGFEIKEVSMPTLKYALAVYYVIVPAEVSSNLARHDGIRYGYSVRGDANWGTPASTAAQARSEVGEHLAAGPLTLDLVYGLSRSEGFMPENKRRIMIGNFVLSSGFYDAYFMKAAKARTLIIDEYNKAFKDVDFLLTPVSSNPAFKIGEKVNDPLSMYLEDVMSVPVNLAGLPALAFPAGKTDTGLPVGLQLIGPRRSDAALIKFAEENL